MSTPLPPAARLAATQDPAAFRFEAAVPVFAPLAPAVEGDSPPGATDTSRPRAFTGLAYSGDVIPGHWAWGALVIDLASLALPSPCPCLLNHEREDPVGHCTLAVSDNALRASGRLLDYGKGADVAMAADQGFPWQLSIHAEPGVVEEIQAGTAITVNGRDFTGPLTVFRQTRIRELSFTPTGYDYRTSAQVLSQPAAAPGPVTPRSSTPEDRRMSTPSPDDLVAQVAALSAQVAELTVRAESAEAAQSASQTAAREQALLSLFAELGRPVPEASRPHYLSLSDDAFAALAADLKAAKPAAPAPLFTEQALGAPAGPLDNPAAALSLSSIYAARRAN